MLVERRYNRVPIKIKFFIVQVRVGIKKHSGITSENSITQNAKNV